MKLRFLFLLLVFSQFTFATTTLQRVSDWCQSGGQNVTVPASLPSQTFWQQSYPGCTVKVYLAGTLTLAAIYSDANNTPQSNPFTANQNGYWFFFALPNAYDVQFSGSTIPVPFTLRYSIPIVPAAALNGLYDVSQYGAVPDGATDNTAAFNAAIAAMPNGGTLLVGPGNPGIYLTNTVNIAKNINIWCPSSATIIRNSTSGTFQDPPLAVHSVFNFTGVTGGGVKNCTLDTNYPTSTFIWGIVVINSSGLDFSNNIFQNIGGTAISLYDDNNIWVKKNNFINVFKSGVRIEKPLPNVGSTSNIHISDNVLTNMNLSTIGGFASIQTYGTEQNSPVPESQIWVDNNYISNPGTVGVGLDRCDYCYVQNNRVIGNGTRGECIAVIGSHMSISQNSVNNCGSAGVMLYGVNYADMTHNTIIDNVIWDNSHQGIALVFGQDNTNLSYELVSRNHTFSVTGTPAQNWGIQTYCDAIPADCSTFTGVVYSNNIITGNDGTANVVGAINFSTSPTRLNSIYQLNIDTPGILGLTAPITFAASTLNPPNFGLNTNATGSGAQPSGINFQSNSQFAGSIGYSGAQPGRSNSVAITAPLPLSTISFYTPEQTTGITISAISQASNAVLTVASVPASVAAGSLIYLTGLLPGTCQNLVSSPQKVISTAGGTTITIAADSTTCVYVSGAKYTTTIQTGIIEPRGWQPPVITFSNLSAAPLDFFVWCPDCHVATPCTSGGTGAFAFRNGTWKCPF